MPLLAALTDRAGMMISPKAAKELGDKFGTRPVCAGPYKFVERVAQGKIVVERFADYWDKANIQHRPHRVRAHHRLDRAAGQPALGRSAHDRARLADRSRGDPRRQPSSRWSASPELGLPDDPAQREQRAEGQGAGATCASAQAIDLAIDRETHRQDGLQQRVHPRQPVGQPVEPVLQREVPRAEARRGQGPPAPARGRPAESRPSRSSCRRSATGRRPRWSSRPCSPRPGSP